MNIFVISADIDFVEQEHDNRGKTVSVFLGNGTNEISNYRCNYCGKIAFQYSGTIDSVYLGAKKIDKSILDVLCHQCKVKFRVY